MLRYRAGIVSLILIVLASGTTLLSGQTATTFVPARWLAGPLPLLPAPDVVGRIEEAFETVVDATGRVAGLTPLRASPLTADPVAAAVPGWRFRAATDAGAAVQSRVLVAAIIRPPQLDNSPTLGNPPVTPAAPSNEIPFPLLMESPAYPPLAIGDGVVLVEVLVDVDGRGSEFRTLTGFSGFDVAALEAAGRWSFRPAQWKDRPVEAYAYLVFIFRQPVVGAR